MKDLKYIAMALVCALFVSCMADDYDAPKLDESPYGNNELTETNVLSIEQLKTKYSNVIANNGMEEIKEDIQIKGRVTGNDIQGNIYNQFALQDETGALLISVTQGGLYGYLPVGQEVLVSLKGLIIGGYGKQPQVGGIYTNVKTGAESVGRMSRFVWESHYKLLGKVEPSTVTPTVFDPTKISDESYLAQHCGKLMTLKGVSFKDANGKNVFAPNDNSVQLLANAANRALNEYAAGKMVVRTSTYADFANEPLPTGKVDITGVFTRFNNVWQILLRSSDDIQPAQ